MKNTITKLLIFSLFLIISLTDRTLSAQTPQFAWAKAIGGIGIDDGYSIAIDASGNVYTTGYFHRTVDFDPGPGEFFLTADRDTVPFLYDIFISKLDSSGNFVWAKSLGGKESDESNSIAIDLFGNVYIVGYFMGTADFNLGTDTFNITSAGGKDIFISKLDSSGNFIWTKSIGGKNDDEGLSIAIDDSGNVYTTGYISDTVDHGSGPETFYFKDIFISKSDNYGNFLWTKKISGKNIKTGFSITIDKSGNIYYAGVFSDTIDFDPGSDTYYLIGKPNYLSYSVFISKLTNSGNFIWAKSIEAEYGKSLAVDDSGNIYATGNFYGRVDFDPGPDTFYLASLGVDDIYLLKLDSLGSFVWAKAMGGTGFSGGRAIYLDTSNNIYLTGYFTDTVDFDPSGETYNLAEEGLGIDIFISKFDHSGNFVWAISMRGEGYNQGNSIAIDAFNNVYTTGHFQNTVDFDPGEKTYNLTSAGRQDVFIHKLKQCDTVINCPPIGIKELFRDNRINLFPNPNSGTFTLTFNGAQNNNKTQLKVFNVLGEIVYSSAVSSNFQTIDLSSYPKSIYFIKVQSDTQIWMDKIILQ